MHYSGIFCGSELRLEEADMYAIDFDGTLFKSMDPYDPRKFGAPIWPMILYTRKLLQAGKKVVIFTARMNSQVNTPKQLAYTRQLIRKACKEYLGQALPITAEKHPGMKVIIDDKAVPVEKNYGFNFLTKQTHKELR